MATEYSLHPFLESHGGIYWGQLVNNGASDLPVRVASAGNMSLQNQMQII